VLVFYPHTFTLDKFNECDIINHRTSKYTFLKRKKGGERLEVSRYCLCETGHMQKPGGVDSSVLSRNMKRDPPSRNTVAQSSGIYTSGPTWGDHS